MDFNTCVFSWHHFRRALRFDPPYLRASLDRGSLEEDEVLMEVLRVLAVAVVGVVGVGEFNLLLVTTPLNDADDIRKSMQRK